MIAFKNYVAILLFHRLESRMNIQMKVLHVIHTTILSCIFELKKVDFTITSKREISEILSNRWIVLNMTTRVTTEFEPSVPHMVQTKLVL